jgi:hypothetical protein
MRFRNLIVLTACAALLGVAASGFVRLHSSRIVLALAPTMPQASQPEESVQVDGGLLPTVDCQPADPTETVLGQATQNTEMEEPPNSAPREDSTGRRHRFTRAARSSPSRNSAHSTFSEELDRGIRKLGKRRYEIERHTLELALRNLHALSKWVRVTPESRDGKPFGFRVFAIKPDGPVAKLGLRNDDVLVSIHGLDIATADQVLNAYGKLKQAPRLELGLVREGQTLVQEYLIR